jgi:hypothetical protein
LVNASSTRRTLVVNSQQGTIKAPMTATTEIQVTSEESAQSAVLPARRRRLRRWVVVVAVGATLASTAVLWRTGGPDNRAAEARSGSKALDATAFEDVTGIRVLRVSVVGGGGMVELRFQVLDPAKADIVHDATNPPMIVAESGDPLAQPWHQHSHDRELHSAATYSEILVNQRGVVQRGERVTVLVGPWRLEHMVVQ